MTKEEFQISKVKTRIPKWFQSNDKTISKTILLKYLELYFSVENITYSMLKNKCQSIGTFSTNFSKMIDYTEKNHGKVFSKNDDDIIQLWTPVKDFILQEYEKYQKIFDKIIYPDEIVDIKISEGAKKRINVNIFERNIIARNKCIEYYGYDCSVCGFNFKKIYGEIGQDFIHVHHILPLANIKDTYIVDPIKDLRPVCPNCHAMLHRGKEVKSISELKEIIQS